MVKKGVLVMKNLTKACLFFFRVYDEIIFKRDVVAAFFSLLAAAVCMIYFVAQGN